MSTTPTPPSAPSLEDTVKPIRGMLKDAALGPLRAASRVLMIQDQWHLYIEEAGGVSFSAYIRDQFGKGCGPLYWHRRAEAWKRFGPSTAFHHATAVRLLSVPADMLLPVLEALRQGTRENGNVPMPYQAARNLIVKMLGGSPAAREAEPCANCVKLLDEIARLKSQ